MRIFMKFQKGTLLHVIDLSEKFSSMLNSMEHVKILMNLSQFLKMKNKRIWLEFLIDLQSLKNIHNMLFSLTFLKKKSSKNSWKSNPKDISSIISITIHSKIWLTGLNKSLETEITKDISERLQVHNHLQLTREWMLNRIQAIFLWPKLVCRLIRLVLLGELKALLKKVSIIIFD